MRFPALLQVRSPIRTLKSALGQGEKAPPAPRRKSSKRRFTAAGKIGLKPDFSGAPMVETIGKDLADGI